MPDIRKGCPAFSSKISEFGGKANSEFVKSILHFAFCIKLITVRQGQ